MARDFLLEIGTEELPSSACHVVLDQLPDRVRSLFAAVEVDIGPEAVKVLVSPRRIAVLVKDVPESQTAREVAQRGPAVESAFDGSGNPTPAALGFAKAKKTTPDQLQVREDLASGRSFVYYVSTSEAKATAEVLPDVCLRLVRDMYFPKNMRWGYALRFSRPMRWLVALFGSEVVPFEVAGVVSGRQSRGHRWLGQAVDVGQPGEYIDALRGAFVMVDQVEREAFIRAEIARLAEPAGLHTVDPMNKMAEVLHLVEWPTVLEGSFREDHLRLPPEVLIIAMQSHQRYFPLLDAEGALSNRFIFVMNGDPHHAATIRAGNERVLEGRIEDAEFSFDKDVATGIEEMARNLDRVVFHDKIGTMREKADRLVALTAWLADAEGVTGEARQRALEAARLAKADQVSVMVREFADLEGTMGMTYAAMEGFPAEVAQAVREQFLPDAAEGALPQTLPGSLLATAEKVDNIIAAFACAEPPTGSKDPYGLRRAAMGMVNIALAQEFGYRLRPLAEFAYTALGGHSHLVPQPDVVDQALEFVLERLAKALTDQGVSRETVDAVLPTSDGFLDLRARALALDEARRAVWFDDLVVVYTRPSNLAKKLPPDQAGPVDASLFGPPVEAELHDQWKQAAARAGEAVEEGRYLDAMQALAGIRPTVDRYFDEVLVMAEEDAVRINRLRLLASVAGTVRQLAWLEKLPG
ncbi:MAG: glycine--tRNA ligase subunit beta [Gaiellales bacterium]|nr:glycine--tRNA ligase subunit beta [Gaiellales bacterium]